MSTSPNQSLNPTPRYKQLLVDIFSENKVPADSNQAETIIKKLLAILTDREQQIINLRYGLTDGPPKTLQQIGDLFGVSRERIRQIERKALRRLKHPSRRKILEHCGQNDNKNRPTSVKAIAKHIASRK